MECKIFYQETMSSLKDYFSSPLYAGFKLDQLVAQQVDAHILALEGGALCARCSVWYKSSPRDKYGKQVGAIGHFEADSKEGALAVLLQAERLIIKSGRKAVVAPMDGSTYGRYRFQTFSDGSPSFLLEPVNPAQYPVYLREMGYLPDEIYCSTVEEPIESNDEKTQNLVDMLLQNGIRIEQVDLTHLADVLKDIYFISVNSFSNNLYYTNISEEAFCAQYLALAQYFDPRFIFLAYSGEQAIGFLFGLPDYLQQARGEPLDRLILKTIAVLPEYRRLKIGSAFFALARQAAARAGFRSIINALAYVDNVSLQLSNNRRKIREYTLFKKEL